MRTEKHIIKNRYNSHALVRNIPVYEMSTVHCSASPMEGYKGTEVTLIDNAAWNEKFSAWALTGATATGNNIVLNNDVTAQGLYETAKNVTLQTNGNGTLTANKTSGFIGDQISLTATPSTDYTFSGYTITGATLTGNKFNLTGSNVTAKAWFDVKELLYNLPSSSYLVHSVPGHTAYDHPEWINGTINFGSSGYANNNDRYLAIKYDSIQGSDVDTGSIAYNVATTIKIRGQKVVHAAIDKYEPVTSTITYNDFAMYASNHACQPGIFTYVDTNSNMRVNGSLTGASSAMTDTHTTLYLANASQNVLRFSGYINTGFNGWGVAGCRESNRQAVKHKYVLDTKSRTVSAFVGSQCRCKLIGLGADQFEEVLSYSAIQSISLSDLQNGNLAAHNIKVASFSTITDAYKW